MLASLERVGYHEWMRIACPACNAAYDVPDAELRDDRVVRCARCGTDWAPVVPVAQADPEIRPEMLADAAPGAEHDAVG